MKRRKHTAPGVSSANVAKVSDVDHEALLSLLRWKMRDRAWSRRFYASPELKRAFATLESASTEEDYKAALRALARVVYDKAKT